MGWNIVRGAHKNPARRRQRDLPHRRQPLPAARRAFVLLTNEGHLVDHYVAARQLTDAWKRIVLGKAPPPVSPWLVGAVDQVGRSALWS